jgi:hypothetical protein
MVHDELQAPFNSKMAPQHTPTFKHLKNGEDSIANRRK